MPRSIPVPSFSRRSRKLAGKARRAPPRNRRAARPRVSGNSLATQPLSAADAAFLYIERKEIPLAIACVTLFEGPIPFREFVSSIVSKLHLVPRYKQVVEMPSLNIGRPVWKRDLHFDIRRHVFHVVLPPPGGEAELEALVGSIFSTLLDRNKPLWEIYVVDGLKDGRGAIIWRVHHALADGISGSRLVELFLDSTPSPAPKARAMRQQPPVPTPRGVPEGDLFSRLNNTLHELAAAPKGLLGFVQALLGAGSQNGSRNLPDVLPELLMSVERLPFNRPCGVGRKFCWADIPMAEVQSVRDVLGGRLNDVVLTVLAAALARYVKLHGETTAHRLVRIVFPINLRKPGEEGKLGNQISFVPVALPLDIRDPAELLQAVAARTEAMKHSGACALLGLAAACIAKAPAALQALFWWGLPELILPIPLLNMICTNVPGPQMPLYAVGKRMQTIYPQVPTGYELGVNCAVESYDGKLFFGLIADPHVAPDANRLRDFLLVSFRELCRAARKRAQRAAPQPHQRRMKVHRPRRAARIAPAVPAVAAESAAPPIPEPAKVRQAVTPPAVAAAPSPPPASGGTKPIQPAA